MTERWEVWRIRVLAVAANNWRAFAPPCPFGYVGHGMGLLGRTLQRALSITSATPTPTTGALAQDDVQRTATAMVLYDRAVAAMDAKDYATACPKLEEATRLSPSAIGVRFALAECYEGLGRIASAWYAYVAAADAAAEANQTAREKKARALADALRPKLARMRLVIPEEVKALPGLAFTRDSALISAALWGASLPVDKGSHSIVVEATDMQPVEIPLKVDADGTESVVTVPRLRRKDAVTLVGRAVAAIGANDYAHACPALEEAVELEPSVLDYRMTLAKCNEGLGKLASAWANYVIVADAASKANQPEHQAKAEERAAALRPQLALLRIVVPEEVKGLRGLKIRRDGLPIGPGQWGDSLPIDKGTHVISVNAEGKKGIEKTFEVESDKSETVLKLPILRDERPEAPGGSQAPPGRSDDTSTGMIVMDADVGGIVLVASNRAVCSLPCMVSEKQIWGKELVFRGRGMPDSSVFQIKDARQSGILVSAGNSDLFWGGGVLLGAGAIGGAYGITRAASDKTEQAAYITAAVLPALLLGPVFMYSGRTTFRFVDPSSLSIKF